MDISLPCVDYILMKPSYSDPLTTVSLKDRLCKNRELWALFK
jgi:hypothetical protein